MEGQYFVYRHIRLDTNVPFYIGIGKKPKDYTGHRTEFKRAFNTSHRNKYWKNIVNSTDYRVEILFESSDLEIIKEKEIEFISLYGMKQDGGTLSNMTSGGEFTPSEVYAFRKNFKHTEETKLRLSEVNKGRKATEETKKILSEINKKNKSHERLNFEGSCEKAKVSRRNGLPEVLYVPTGKVYNSLPDACEELGLNLANERRRMYRKSIYSPFQYLNAEILTRYKRKKVITT
jgi:hypothetical protein